MGRISSEGTRVNADSPSRDNIAAMYLRRWLAILSGKLCLRSQTFGPFPASAFARPTQAQPTQRKPFAASADGSSSSEGWWDGTGAAMDFAGGDGVGVGTFRREGESGSTARPGPIAEGAVVHSSVRAARGPTPGAAVSDGGIILPSSGILDASAGAIDLRCQAPEDWPATGDRTLFHAASAAHEHVTLFFRDAGLIAVYKGGKDYFSSIRYPASGKWKPGEWHRVRFGWQGKGGDVEFILLVDDHLAGVAGGQKLPNWPTTFEVASRAHGSPWKGLLKDVVLSTTRIPIPGMEPGERAITIRAEREVGECYPFWTVANCNKPQQFLDPGHAADTQSIRETGECRLSVGGRWRNSASSGHGGE